ncbi:ribonuclease T2-like protein [Chaetomium strumarium]|uniref:Ribonuclease T2-like protein n=1 Tax=Chaetomium strumarium TaxID=1170767 RepID=A0AAJ0M450_9PEZI|nr:ribonuclease T2-like protein [Chaetomium strumarium]
MAPSLRALVSYASSLVSRLPFFNSNDVRDVSPYEPLSAAPFCPFDGPMSCHNDTPVTGDSCCFVYPSGRMLLAQRWDQDIHVHGAEEDWTLRGLWADLCDGSKAHHCSLTPKYTNITAILRHYGQGELLEFMNRYWFAASGPNADLWTSEFNKHGTCINTLSPACYGPSHRPGIEVIDYFVRAAALFRMLDTYRALQQVGIVPDAGRQYALADVRKALERFSGGRVVLRCSSAAGDDEDVSQQAKGDDVLREVRYVFFITGSLQTGQFVPAQELGLGPDGNAGNCAPRVRYLPKRRMLEL